MNRIVLEKANAAIRLISKEERKKEKFERFGATESAAKTSREFKDTYVQSQVERRSGG